MDVKTKAYDKLSLICADLNIHPGVLFEKFVEDCYQHFLKRKEINRLTSEAINQISAYLIARGVNLSLGLTNFLLGETKKYPGTLKGLRSIVDYNVLKTVSNNIKSIREKDILLKNAIAKITKKIWGANKND